MICQKCSADHGIRIRSRSTFDNITSLAGPGSTIWMDNMSINQNDPADVAAQVAVMGEIYGRAECVSVLLPESDEEAYDTIPVHPDDPEERYMHLWAICPLSVMEGGGALFVAREGLNGTLVIAKKSMDSLPKIAAYLTISDIRSGTFLVPVSEDGQVNVLLKTPQRSDIVNSRYMADRKLCATVQLVDFEVIAAESGDRRDPWGQPLEALVAYLASTAERENEELVQAIGDHRSVIGGILGDLADRRESPGHRELYDREWLGFGVSALQIDIGHPELVPEGSDADNQRRMANALLRRRLSLPDNIPE